MTKTSVQYVIAAIAVCGTLALASKSPVLAGDALQLSPVEQLVGQPEGSRPVARSEEMPKPLDPMARWEPFVYG